MEQEFRGKFRNDGTKKLGTMEQELTNPDLGAGSKEAEPPHTVVLAEGVRAERLHR